MTAQVAKRISLVLAMALIIAAALVLVLPTRAYATPSTGKVYTVSNVNYTVGQERSSYYAVVRSSNNVSSITIPESVKLDGTSCPVKAIFPGAFNGKDKLKTLTIDAPVEYFPISMCYNCTSLQTVALKYPDKLTEIYPSVFEGCSNLKSISDLKSVWRIDEKAFQGCSSLEALTTLALRRLGESAFRDCVSLTHVRVVGDIGSNANLKKIPAYAFYGCKKLTDPGNLVNVTTVGTAAFNGCSSLERVSFSALETIEDLAFQGCSSMTSIDLTNVKTIGTQAFENCTILNVFYHSKVLQKVGARAFRNCSYLRYAYLADTVTEVGPQAYEGCKSLESLQLSDNLRSLPAKMCKGCTSLTNVRISAYVDGSIGAEAFANCTNLTSVYVTNKDVKFLGEAGASPFSGCSGLTLYGYAPCTAKTYAAGEPGVTFVDLNGADVPTVTVRFHASLTPDTESATGSMPNAQAVLNGVYTLPGNEGFEYPGYIFKSWRVRHNGEGLGDHPPGDRIKNVEGDIECYALWRQGCTVTLKRSAGASAETQMSTHELGSMYTVPPCPFAAPEGQVFKCWITDIDDDGNLDENEYEYYPGYPFQFDKTTPTSMTLTAKFVTPITATFKAYQGATFSDGTTTKTLLTNAEYSFDEFPEVTRDGFAFAGWQVTYDMSHTKIVGIGESLGPYSTYQGGKQVVTLVATWKPNTARTIVLDPNGGTLNGSEVPALLSTDDKGVIYDDEILKYKPVRAHYQFVKWRDPAGRLFASHAYNTFNTDVTLMAEWEPIKVSKIALSPASLTLVEGAARQLSAKATPADALDTSVTWSSSNSKVATVDANGKVTAKAVGAAVITCASNDGGAEATCQVTVEPAPAPGDGSEEAGEPAVEPGPAPAATSARAGVDKKAANLYLTSYAKEADPNGSQYLPLRLTASKTAKHSVKLSWKKVAGAAKYVVYGSKCGKGKLVKVATVSKSKNAYVWKKLSGKKLSKNTYYKAVVVALNSAGKVVSTSTMVHAATAGGKKGNCTKVTTKAKDGKVTLKVGKAFKLRAKIVKPAGKKIANHRKAKIVYVSSNNKIAKVSKTGKIIAKKKGACYVYAYAQNGVAAKVKVKVKAPTTAKATTTVKKAGGALTAAR